MKSLPDSDLTNEDEIIISDRLKFLWEQYIKVVNWIIVLSTGTLLVFLNNILSEKVLGRFLTVSSPIKYLGFCSSLLIFFGLVSTMIWRFYSQVFMEIEILGTRELVDKYIKKTNPLDKHKYYFQIADELNLIRYRKIWKYSRNLACLFLLCGWIGFFVFYFLLVFYK